MSIEVEAPSGIGYVTYYADAQCKKEIALVRPFLSGVQYTVPSLDGIAVDPTNCMQNVACVIQGDSPQCEAAGGGANMPVLTVIKSITTPDENGCDILSSLEEAVPSCDCAKSASTPGCYFQSITANAFTKLVNAPGFAMDVDGGKPDDEDNFCEDLKNEKQCGKKSGGACVWKEDGCVGLDGGRGTYIAEVLKNAAVNEDVVGAKAMEQSNSGNGMTDLPLASTAMMLLSLYYALKW